MLGHGVINSFLLSRADGARLHQLLTASLSDTILLHITSRFKQFGQGFVPNYPYWFMIASSIIRYFHNYLWKILSPRQTFQNLQGTCPEYEPASSTEHE